MLDRIDIKYFKLAVQEHNIHSEATVDITARCPVCGDSHRGNKARLHLYTKNNLTFVNCFNGGCPVENKTVFTFLRDFFPDLLSSYKRETFHLRMDNLKETFNPKTDSSFINLAKDSDNNVFASLKKFEDPKDREVTEAPKEIKNPKITSKANIKTLRINALLQEFENSPAEEYVKSRNVEYKPEKYGKFYYSPNNIELDETVLYIKNSVVIPLYYEDKIYGFYSRSIDKKDFYTFIWNEQGYKAWNYFNVKANEPVYIFEGIFDALSSGLENIVASLGAKISDDYIKELKDNGCDVIFVLDSDKTGLNNSLRYTKQGYKVYVPPKDLKAKDINALRKTMSTNEIKELILNNLYSGIRGTIKINQLL